MIVIEVKGRYIKIYLKIELIKSIPEQQQCVRFRKSQKVLLTTSPREAGLELFAYSRGRTKLIPLKWT